MNNQQAKEILLLYRPGTDDPADPETAAALELAHRDAELGRWFAEQSHLQETLRARLREIPVPEGLKEQILSERKAHTAPAPTRKPLRVVLASAAAAVLVAGLGYLFLQPARPSPWLAFRARMSGYALRHYPDMDIRTNDLNQIRAYLAHKGRGDYVLPKALEKAQPTGCSTRLAWNNKPITMVCFNSGKPRDPNEPDLFLFVIDRAQVPGAPPMRIPEYFKIDKLITASWSSADKTYLLEGFGDEEFLRSFL